MPKTIQPIPISSFATLNEARKYYKLAIVMIKDVYFTCEEFHVDKKTNRLTPKGTFAGFSGSAEEMLKYILNPKSFDVDPKIRAYFDTFKKHLCSLNLKDASVYQNLVDLTDAVVSPKAKYAINYIGTALPKSYNKKEFRDVPYIGNLTISSKPWVNFDAVVSQFFKPNYRFFKSAEFNEIEDFFNAIYWDKDSLTTK